MASCTMPCDAMPCLSAPCGAMPHIAKCCHATPCRLGLLAASLMHSCPARLLPNASLMHARTWPGPTSKQPPPGSPSAASTSSWLMQSWNSRNAPTAGRDAGRESVSLAGLSRTAWQGGRGPIASPQSPGQPATCRSMRACVANRCPQQRSKSMVPPCVVGHAVPWDAGCRLHVG